MAVYRAYYGDALYGQDTFGLSGSITDGATIIIPDAVTTVSAVKVISFASADAASSSVTASAEVIKLGAAAVAPSVSVAANANRIIGVSASDSSASSATAAGEIIKDGAVSASLQNVVVSVAETYAETDGYRSGYGLRTYGTNIYGENHSVEEASASISCTSSVTVSCQRVRENALDVDATSTFTSNGVIDVVGRANVSLSSAVNISYNRVRLFSATDTPSLTVNVNARYKWLDADDPTTIWTDAADPTNTWTEADYLERAA